MRPAGDGVWETDLTDPRLSSFLAFDHRPYMFRIVKDDGRVAYRTDLYSRCQIGRGTTNPANLGKGQTFSGRREDLDGSVSCSVVVDPQWVTAHFRNSDWPETEWTAEQDFWKQEFDPQRPLPTRIEDLVIYEMHIGGLGAGKTEPDGTPVPGDLADAMGMLDYLVDLGVNAVELMPLSQFEGWATWGYGTSHYCAVEFSGGGRDEFKYFVRECHRGGIAVILDVVYNHYNPDGERAEWGYDSDDPERNIYYWYEGSPANYPDHRRVPRQRFQRLGAPFQRTMRPAAVHLQRGGSGAGVPRRRIPRGPDHLDPLLQHTACRRPPGRRRQRVRREIPARTDPHTSPGQAARFPSSRTTPAGKRQEKWRTTNDQDDPVLRVGMGLLGRGARRPLRRAHRPRLPD